MRLVIAKTPGIEPGIPQKKVFKLDYDPAVPVIRVGRHLSNEIVISDVSVSRHHTELTVQPEGLLVKDLGSSNGTYINNQRLVPHTPGLARPGDSLQIGNVLTYLYGDFQADPSSAILPPAEITSPRLAPDMGKVPVRSSPLSASQPQYPIYSQLPVSTYSAPPTQNTGSHPAKAEILIPEKPPIKKSGLRWFLTGLLLGCLLLGLVIIGLVILLLNSGSPNPSLSPVKPIPLPPAIFASPANSETTLGITLARPSSWKKVTEPGVEGLTFSLPDNLATNLTLEKPPGRIIKDANLSPEAALRQYLENVRANSQDFKFLIEPAPTRLLDGTEGYYSRLVFSPNGQQLKNYTINILTFNCRNSLFFASAGAEGKNYSGTTQQDLEAAIANFKC